MRLFVDDPIEYRMTLAIGEGSAFSGVICGERVIVPDARPYASIAEPGEVWRVRMAYWQHGVWEAQLIGKLNGDSACRTQERQPIPAAERVVGRETPPHLELALRTLPERIEVSYDYLNIKGPIALHQGVVLGTFSSYPRSIPVVLGRCYAVSPKISGSNGIYCVTLGQVGVEITDLRVPDYLEVAFDDADSEGPLTRYEGFVVRPSRTWHATPPTGRPIRVKVVKVNRLGSGLIVVVPA